MADVTYEESTRGAKRRFTATETKLEVIGRLRGLRYSRKFEFSELSSASQNMVQIRFDIVRRCIVLMMVSVSLGLLIVQLEFPYSHFVAWFFGGLALLFLKSAYDWGSKKEEIEIFRTKRGNWAFDIYNDSPGKKEFTGFVLLLKSRIEPNCAGNAEDQKR
jgi:hypothetical protein